MGTHGTRGPRAGAMTVALVQLLAVLLALLGVAPERMHLIGGNPSPRVVAPDELSARVNPVSGDTAAPPPSSLPTDGELRRIAVSLSGPEAPPASRPR